MLAKTAPEEAREVTVMARRLAALCLLPPALDDNYRQVEENAFPWETLENVGGRSLSCGTEVSPKHKRAHSQARCPMFASFCDVNMGTACTTSRLRRSLFCLEIETENRNQPSRALPRPGYRAKNVREPGAPLPHPLEMDRRAGIFTMRA